MLTVILEWLDWYVFQFVSVLFVSVCVCEYVCVCIFVWVCENSVSVAVGVLSDKYIDEEKMRGIFFSYIG